MPGPEPGTVFDSNLCDRIIDIGLPAKDCKQYLLVMSPEKLFFTLVSLSLVFI